MLFTQYTEVKKYDSALRNAIRLDCVELMQRAIAKGADVNCRYSEDWNTPLHLAIINRCQSSLISELMNHSLNYGLVNRDNLTACELALQDGFPDLAKRMLVKEFQDIECPVDAVYEMLTRNSVQALEMLIAVLKLSDYSLAECLSMAWKKIEVMNVAVNPELEVFVHLTLIRLDYTDAVENVNSQKSQVDTEEQMQYLITEIGLLEQKFDTGWCHDITDEFLEQLRLILKYMFVTKSILDRFPAMQLEYCIAIYLATFDRRPELDLYRLVINKRLVIDFLKVFKCWYEKPYIDQRMSPGLLKNLIRHLIDNKEKTCIHLLGQWRDISSCIYKWKELNTIRSYILKNHNTSKFTTEMLEAHPDNAILKAISDNINKMFEVKKTKKLFKNLRKTFFKLKQMYSLQKCVWYVNVIHELELNPARCCYYEMLTIQRVIQVLGETLKSTKQSPNISTNLRSVLEFVSPAKLLKWISKLRQYFSHDYSATKHTLYRRLRDNDIELIDFFKRVKSDLLKVAPLLTNIFTDQMHRYFKSFLGYALKLESAELVQSYAESCRVRPGFKVDFDFLSTDILEMRRLLKQLEESYNPQRHSGNIDVVAKIYTKIKLYVDFQKSKGIDFMTEMVLGCIGELLLCDNLVYQRRLAHFYLHTSFSPKHGGYGAVILFIQTCPLLQKLLAMEVMSSDENSLKRTAMIQNLLKLANVEDIQQLHELTLLNDKSLTNISIKIGNNLVEDDLTFDQTIDFNKQLQKYYSNLFAIDDKYRIVKTFCKKNHLKYKSQAVTQCRTEDINECQKVLSDFIRDIAEVISYPESIETSELVSLIVPCVKYKINKIELFSLETLLLEVLEILSSQCVLMDNRFKLMTCRAVITGRNLRNYLAHDGLVYETICGNRNPDATLLLNAMYVSKYCNIKLFSKREVPLRINPPTSAFNMKHWTKRLVEHKSNLFKNIEHGDFQLLISMQFEAKARDYNGRSVLIALIEFHSEKMIHLLLGRSSKIKEVMEVLIAKSLNQEHNFFDDDDFTLAQLISVNSIQKHMNFYLAMKFHHFELENELDLLYDGAYTKESLHMAILFKNEKSALSIIDDNRLYSFCQQDAWHFSNSILTNAVLHKLPTIVRRICEKSPEIIERTNASQETPLRLALATGCTEIVKILLEFGAKASKKNKSPIVYALQVRKDELLELLLPSNEELLSNEQLLNQLVIYAGFSNHCKLLERLLPVVSSRTSLVNSLFSAVVNNQLETVRVLLNFDVTIVNELNEHDSTVLFQACYKGFDSMVNLLLEKGADCTIPHDNSALQCAIDQNRHNHFKMMLQRKIINSDLLNRLFHDLFALSRYKWIWSAFRAGDSFNIILEKSLIRKDIDEMALKFLSQLIKLRKDMIHQIDTYILASAVSFKNYEFVKYVLSKHEPSYNTLDRTRLLNCAVKANDKDMVSILIDAGCSVNSSDEYRITPLGTAVSAGKPDMVKLLIKLKANPNLESMGNCCMLLDASILMSGNIFDQLGGKYYRTYPIVLAAIYGYGKIVEYLLKHGAEGDIRDEEGFTALIATMAQGDVELTDTLINCGASVVYVRSFLLPHLKNGSVLHYAAIHGHLEIVKRMIEKYQFDLTVKDSDGNTVLHLAVINKQANVVEFFLKTDQLWDNPNNCGDTPLILTLKHLDSLVFNLVKHKQWYKETVQQFRTVDKKTILHVAVLKGDVDLVRTLLEEFDIDHNWIDQSKNTAAYYAVLKKNYDLIKLLMYAQISLTGSNEIPFTPPFVVAILSNQIEIVQLYIELENNAINHIKLYSTEVSNLLCSTIMQNNFSMSKFLIELNVFDLNIPDKNGCTVLDVAAMRDSVRTIDLLVKRGVCLDQTNKDGKSALHRAIENGNLRVAHYLLSKGSSMQLVINYCYNDVDEMNILHYVASIGKVNSLRFLLDRMFFDRSTTDANGKTIGHYAAANRQHGVIEFLIASQFPLDQLDNAGRSSLMVALENEDLLLAKRLKSIGASLNVVQSYCDKYNFVIQSLNNKKTELVKFLTHECSLSVNSTVENILIALAQSIPGSSSDACRAGESQSRIIQHVLDGNLIFVENIFDNASLLEEVKKYRMPTNDKETLLHVVARKGYSSVLRLLLERRVFDIDIGDQDQTTALLEAATFGQKDSVKLLLEHGANIDFVDLQNTTALTRACINSQKEIVQILLDQGAKFDNTKLFRMKDKDGATPLHIAVYGDISLIEILVEKIGIDVNEVDDRGRTALHIASQIGSINAMELLLKIGARLDVKDCDQQTPFVTALISGYQEIAEKLLALTCPDKYLQNFRTSVSHKSILHIALENGFNQVLVLLLNNYGLDCSYTDSEGKSILHIAAAEGKYSILDQLTFDPNLLFLEDKSGETPLSICLKHTHFDVFVILIESLDYSENVEHLMRVFEMVSKLNSNIYVNFYSKWLIDNKMHCIAGDLQFNNMIIQAYDTHPVLYAIQGDHCILLELFLACGVERSFLSDLNPTSWLHIAAFKNLFSLAKVILDDFTIPVDYVDDYGRTPLCCAAISRETDTAKLLLELGANVNFQDSYKRTPLQTALENNCTDMVKLFLAHHANIVLLQEFRYQNDNEHLIQHYLVERGLTEMLLLIISEIDINHGDKFAMTPLHYAAACNQLEMIDILVNAGAKVDSLDVHKTTPLIRAVSKNHLEAYYKLVAYGANVNLVQCFRNDNFDGETVLHITAEMNRMASSKLLVEELNCDINCMDNNGNTPLHYAVLKGSFEVTKYLIGKNANIHIKNCNGRTALQLMEEMNNNIEINKIMN